MRNTLAPINKIPPEVLTLIPNFWETYERNRDIVALTHVCRAWRQTFISCSLWTDFDCVDADKTLVYLERSKSPSINLWLDRERPLLPHDPTFQITPHAIARLKSVGIVGSVESIQDITAHISHPAPLLEDMTINGHYTALSSRSYPTLTPTLFHQDLSSLRKLFIQGVYSALPWRNIVNLTSFTLGHTTEEGEISIRKVPWPPQSQAQKFHPNLWCSKWMARITTVSKKFGHRWGRPILASPRSPPHPCWREGGTGVRPRIPRCPV